ncbi:hypothetical protein BN2475_130014 [Paraburkholderia ribeironis]|uniref:Uncharacterized protein n=1 Tax=Paraburkholderia ribeironis TaxID=1247936 RepID=A0A1N7RS18_9BURK|nr:hypothetical protein BN2475_130014 [Paraburkholderia ribeironis]
MRSNVDHGHAKTIPHGCEYLNRRSDRAILERPGAVGGTVDGTPALNLRTRSGLAQDRLTIQIPHRAGWLRRRYNDRSCGTPHRPCRP